MGTDPQQLPTTEAHSPSPPAVPAAAQAGRLHRVLGVGFGVAVVLGGTIGMGILRTPGLVAARLPDPWLFLGAWVLGGVYALLGAISVAELGAMVPRSGGFYVFARRAFGAYPGFVIGCCDWLNVCGTTALTAMTIGEYSASLWPALEGRGTGVALVILAVVVALHARGVRWGGKSQAISSSASALALLALVACCFLFGERAGPSPPPPPPDVLTLVAAFLVALQSVIYTYDGWYGPIYFGEEVRQPGRSIPRAMVGGVLLVLVVYLLVNLALVHVLPMSRLATEDLAVGGAAEVVFGPAAGTVAAVLALLCLLGVLNACILCAPRILFALARDRLCPQLATAVNTGGTPAVALGLSALVACLFILSGMFTQVLAVLAFFMVTNYTSAFAAVFVLRRREPQTDRPYRVWGYPVTTAAVLAGSIVFLVAAVAADTRNSVFALALLVASYPAFVVMRHFLRPAA
jgi:APA family basic amino acid/polyamine antiporter